MEYPQPSSSGITNEDDRFKNMLKSIGKKYNANNIADSIYNLTKLTDVNTLSESALAEMSDLALLNDTQGLMAGRISDEQGDANKSKDTVNKSEKTSSGLLPMIFGVVPKAINIGKKGKAIAAGLKQVPVAIGKLIMNLAIMTAILGMDSLIFFVQLNIYLFKLLICAVGKILDTPKCVTFYFIDVVVFVMIMCVVSILFMIDMIFMIKYWVGISLVELFMMMMKMFELIDKMVYNYTSVHIFRYPEPIINLCYKCSVMGDTRSFRAAAGSMFNDIFVLLPTNIGEPIGEITTGFGHLFSFFF